MGPEECIIYKTPYSVCTQYHLVLTVCMEEYGSNWSVWRNMGPSRMYGGIWDQQECKEDINNLYNSQQHVYSISSVSSNVYGV